MVHPQISARPALVVDEAHTMPDDVLGQVEVKLRSDRLAEFDWSIPDCDDFQEYVDWMKPKAKDLTEKLEEIKSTLEMQAQVGDVDQQLVKKHNRVERLKGKMVRLADDWELHEEPWVVQEKDEYDERKEEYVTTLTFRPVTPYRFMGNLVFSKGSKVVISSATPPKPELLGIDPSKAVTNAIPSEFPVGNRPCYVDPVGKMSKKHRMDNLPRVARKVTRLAVGKTLIHCHTYKFARELAKKIGGIDGPESLMIQDRNNREESVELWKESDKQYFLSADMYDGLDLKDDACRTNFLCVCPFPYLGDPQIQKRKEVEGDRFFNWNTAMRIMQGYGRSTRSKEDWSNTYILDSNFVWFYKQNQDLFFPWFDEALVWDND